jgi:hypothetical protein
MKFDRQYIDEHYFARDEINLKVQEIPDGEPYSPRREWAFFAYEMVTVAWAIREDI